MMPSGSSSRSSSALLRCASFLQCADYKTQWISILEKQAKITVEDIPWPNWDLLVSGDASEATLTPLKQTEMLEEIGLSEVSLMKVMFSVEFLRWLWQLIIGDLCESEEEGDQCDAVEMAP